MQTWRCQDDMDARWTILAWPWLVGYETSTPGRSARRGARACLSLRCCRVGTFFRLALERWAGGGTPPGAGDWALRAPDRCWRRLDDGILRLVTGANIPRAFPQTYFIRMPSTLKRRLAEHAPPCSSGLPCLYSPSFSVPPLLPNTTVFSCSEQACALHPSPRCLACCRLLVLFGWFALVLGGRQGGAALHLHNATLRLAH